MELLRMQTKCVFSSKRFTVACKLQQCKCATQSTTCSVHYQINNRNRKWMKVVGSLWKVGNLPSHNLKVLFWLQLISMEGGSSPSTFHKQANLSKNIDVQVQSFFFPNKLFELNGSVLFLQHFMYIYSSYMLKYQSLTIIEQTQNNWSLEQSPVLHKSAPARAWGKSISLCSKDK